MSRRQVVPRHHLLFGTVNTKTVLSGYLDEQLQHLTRVSLRLRKKYAVVSKAQISKRVTVVSDPNAKLWPFPSSVCALPRGL